jgi:hypothetical protein
MRHQVPVAISTIVGDIVHNLRPALDRLGDEISVPHVDRPLKDPSGHHQPRHASVAVAQAKGAPLLYLVGGTRRH